MTTLREVIAAFEDLLRHDRAIGVQLPEEVKLWDRAQEGIDYLKMLQAED